jgi:hypothetical protein
MCVQECLYSMTNTAVHVGVMTYAEASPEIMVVVYVPDAV